MHAFKTLLITISLSAGAVLASTNLPPVQYANGAPACPRDIDIQNMDTRLSARVMPPDNAASVRQERQKAVTCRTGGGTYSAHDWKRMNEVIRGDK